MKQFNIIPQLSTFSYGYYVHKYPGNIEFLTVLIQWKNNIVQHKKDS